MNVSFSATPQKVVSAQDILSSHFQLNGVPGEIELFDVLGAEGWRSTNPHPVLSIGKWKTNDPDIAARALETILASFRETQCGFDWMTGPQDAAFLPILAEHGFLAPPLSIAAMVRRISLGDQPDDTNGISSRLVAPVANDGVSEIMAQGFDIPSDVARIYHNAYVQASDLQRTDVYTATKNGDTSPSGVGYLSYIGDGPIVLLRVAATLAQARGCGIYRALIKRRLADAAKAGREFAVVHAYAASSQKALADLGFVKAGELQLHRWRP